MKYALGYANMLYDACRRHRRNRAHIAPPRQIVLHPAVWAELRYELREDFYLLGRPKNADDPWTFMGVPIEIDSQATRPKLITCNNIVEYM